jgi:hypothetical protein
MEKGALLDIAMAATTPAIELTVRQNLSKRHTFTACRLYAPVRETVVHVLIVTGV